MHLTILRCPARFYYEFKFGFSDSSKAPANIAFEQSLISRNATKCFTIHSDDFEIMTWLRYYLLYLFGPNVIYFNAIRDSKDQFQTWKLHKCNVFAA